MAACRSWEMISAADFAWQICFATCAASADGVECSAADKGRRTEEKKRILGYGQDEKYEFYD